MYLATVTEIKKKIAALQTQIKRLQTEVLPTDAPHFDDKDLELLPSVIRDNRGIPKDNQARVDKIKKRLAYLRVFNSLIKDEDLKDRPFLRLTNNASFAFDLNTNFNFARELFRSNLLVNQVSQKNVSTFSRYVYRLSRLLNYYENPELKIDFSRESTNADEVLHDSVESFINRINELEERLKRYSYLDDKSVNNPNFERYSSEEQDIIKIKENLSVIKEIVLPYLEAKELLSLAGKVFDPHNELCINSNNPKENALVFVSEQLEKLSEEELEMIAKKMATQSESEEMDRLFAIETDTFTVLSKPEQDAAKQKADKAQEQLQRDQQERTKQEFEKQKNEMLEKKSGEIIKDIETIITSGRLRVKHFGFWGGVALNKEPGYEKYMDQPYQTKRDIYISRWGDKLLKEIQKMSKNKTNSELVEDLKIIGANALKDDSTSGSRDKLTTHRFYTALANGNFDAIHTLAAAIESKQQDLSKEFEALPKLPEAKI